MKLLAVALSTVALSAQALKLDPSSIQDHDDFMKNFIGTTDVKRITNNIKPEGTETPDPKVVIDHLVSIINGTAE